MHRSDLEKIFEKFRDCHIGIAGDFCLDVYWKLALGEQERSVETGKVTDAVINQRYSPGGAANIAANLASLGPGSIHAFTVIGDDLFGRELKNQLVQLGIDCSGIVVQNENWQSPVYCKRYKDGEELERIDMGRFNRISHDTTGKLIEQFDRSIADLDVLILNRQISEGDGIYSQALLDYLLRLATEQSRCQLVLDFRVLPPHFNNMLVKLNAHEAASYCGETFDGDVAIPEDKVHQFARHIYQHSQRPVMITRGERGLLTYDGQQVHSIAGIEFLQPIDPVGAGDTTIASWAACLASGLALGQSTRFAGLSAGVTLQKLQQTGTASPEEILAFAEDVNYVHRPELAEDLRQARYLDGSEIEIVCELAHTGGIQHAIFDHDGTISVLREGWEPVMERVMLSAILGEHVQTITDSDYHKIVRQVRQFIDKSTGIQTIVQMQSLVHMVTDYGFVPKNAILSAADYKALYNDALMVEINVRKNRLLRKELDVTDFTIKNAPALLKALHERGVKLYLASGTDEADVKLEAEILGYASLFEDRIYGAVGDIRKYSKKLVIDRIIRENNLKGPELITFGDGPVEIRETNKRGGITVGVASDEVRRFGLNPIKRTRLIRAGADVIIADYSQLELLLHYLMGE